MAQSITLTSGSILNGSPITLSVVPAVLSSTPSFHRLIFEVECGMSGGNYETVKMSASIASESNTPIEIDVSSALRMFRDSFEYTPTTTTFPIVKFKVKAYDEYMINGVVQTGNAVYYPNSTDHLCTIFGKFTDKERMLSGATKGVKALSRKPVNIPEIVAVNETHVNAIPYSSVQNLVGNTTLTAPQSEITTMTSEGAKLCRGHKLYVLPSAMAYERQQFRFINGYGVLESISVPRASSKDRKVTSTNHVISRQETFNTFSRATVRKQNNREIWNFTTDPLDEAWVSWFHHEFLMSEHIWIYVGITWFPCTVTPEEDATMIDIVSGEMQTVSFSAEIDINGSPLY